MLERCRTRSDDSALLTNSPCFIYSKAQQKYNDLSHPFLSPLRSTGITTVTDPWPNRFNALLSTVAGTPCYKGKTQQLCSRQLQNSQARRKVFLLIPLPFVIGLWLQ